MKFKIGSSILSAYLQQLNKVVPNNNKTLPVLECIFFELKEGVLYMTGSDGDTRIRTFVPVDEQLSEDAIFMVKGRHFGDAVKELPSQQIEVELVEEERVLKVHYHNGVYSFVSEDASTYVELDREGDPLEKIEMPLHVFARGIKHTLFAASDDESRPITMGIHIDIYKDQIVFVATDGFMLSLYKNNKYKGSGEHSFTLQKKFSQIMNGLLEKEDVDQTAELSLYENQIELKVGNIIIHSRLLMGKYPNYNAVLPKTFSCKMEADRSTLHRTIKRVSAFADQGVMMLELFFTPDHLKVVCEDKNFATGAEETVPVSFEGALDSIAFKSSHVLGILDAFDQDDIVLRLGDKATPAQFSPAEFPDDEQFLAIAMPMTKA